MDADLALALQLQTEYDEEQRAEEVEVLPPARANGSQDPKDLSPADPQWEVLDPSPDVRALFLEFNGRYFWGKLNMVEVRWSPRMTLCAGLCVYEGRGGLCSVRLSEPLLKLRPRKDLVETLLHEMIHALLFVTQNNKDHDGHGPEFQKHMHRINKDAGTNITIYHSFHNEVDNYRTHWWKCNGPCQQRPPYFGLVKRAMNRAPSPRDTWWADHQRTCGGTYTKTKEPEGYGQKKSKAKDEKPSKNVPDIRSFINGGGKLGSKIPGQGGEQNSKNTGKKKQGGGIEVFAGSGDGAGASESDSNAQPSWRPAPAQPFSSKDSDLDSEKRNKGVDVFSGAGKMLGNSSSQMSGQSASGSSGGDNRVITRRIPGVGIITSERYTSPTKQPDGGGNISRPGLTNVLGSSVTNTPQLTPVVNESGGRKRKSLPVDLDVSDGEDYLPKAKHRRTSSVEFSLDTPPGSLVRVPGFRSVCTGHSSDRRHMNSVAIDHAKSNSKSANGKGVKGKSKTSTNNGHNNESTKKRPKRITNVNNYAANRNSRVLLDSSDSNSDDEEFAPLISASKKTAGNNKQKEEQNTDPEWKYDPKDSKRITLDTDSDNDSVILEGTKKSQMEDDPFDLPYKMKFPDSPVKASQQNNRSTGANVSETPGVSSASVPSSDNSEEIVDCPACTVRLPISQINAHLDTCLV